MSEFGFPTKHCLPLPVIISRSGLRCLTFSLLHKTKDTFKSRFHVLNSNPVTILPDHEKFWNKMSVKKFGLLTKIIECNVSVIYPSLQLSID